MDAKTLTMLPRLAVGLAALRRVMWTVLYSRWLGKDEAMAKLDAADRDSHQSADLQQLETDGGAIGLGELRALEQKATGPRSSSPSGAAALGMSANPAPGGWRGAGVLQRPLVLRLSGRFRRASRLNTDRRRERP
jgi:hypothetical protein